jgi:hypothetical protein
LISISSNVGDGATAPAAIAFDFLSVVEAGTGKVGAFQINLTNGSLTPLPAASGLPSVSDQGLAAF